MVRRIQAGDVHHLCGLGLESAWISGTWGGPAGLASSGHAWGAFAEGRLISVACSFFVGERYEEVGVVTEPEFRGLGLSVACAGALCTDIRNRGRTPSWTVRRQNKWDKRGAFKACNLDANRLRQFSDLPTSVRLDSFASPPVSSPVWRLGVRGTYPPA